jgi:hypothetical protein
VHTDVVVIVAARNALLLAALAVLVASLARAPAAHLRLGRYREAASGHDPSRCEPRASSSASS